jgi:hypothetical protein
LRYSTFITTIEYKLFSHNNNMRFFLAMLGVLLLVLAVSGCVRETGEVAVKFEDLDLPQEEAGLIVTEEPEQNETTEEVEEEPETEPLENETEDMDPCTNVICDDSITTCPDETIMTCENSCDPETGECSTCIPDCSDHEVVEEECTLDCGGCEILDQEACECLTVLYCEGNGICEPTDDQDNEWPDGEDCQSFNNCDDADECTLDVFNPAQQDCSHVNICCDDGDACTDDVYNYSTQSCEFSYICCGNDQCDPGDDEQCPEECQEEETPGDVVIGGIDPELDVIAINGVNVDMTNWSIQDNDGKTFTFPDDFIITETTYIYSVGCPENNTDTELYWGTKEGGCRTQPIWNNEGDTAYLKNSSGDVVDFLTYP